MVPEMQGRALEPMDVEIFLCLEADSLIFDLDGRACFGCFVKVDAVVDGVVSPRRCTRIDDDAVDFDDDAFGVCGTCQEELSLKTKDDGPDIAECL